MGYWTIVDVHTLNSTLHLLYRVSTNLNIPPPLPPGHLNFSIFGGQIPIPQFQKDVQIPHM